MVPWADRLWTITYAPHKPSGSSDKLYEITPDLRQVIRPESIGGTPANRMIHRESQQLFIGPYAIGADRTVRIWDRQTWQEVPENQAFDNGISFEIAGALSAAPRKHLGRPEKKQGP